MDAPVPLPAAGSRPLPLDKFTWEKQAITHSGLSPTTRHVGLAMAVYADEEGANIFPGVERLMADTGRSKRAVLRALEQLRDSQLVARTFARRRSGRRGTADEYQLTVPSRIPPGHPLHGSDLGYEPGATGGTCQE